MIVKLEPNLEQIEKGWKTKKDRKVVLDHVHGIKLTEDFNHAYLQNTNIYVALGIFKGYEDIRVQPKLEDYGYALTGEAIKKYVLSNFGDSDPTEYMLEISVMPFDYEKYYKNGSYIDLDGNDTGNDFFDQPDYKELEKKAELPGYWISFTVLKLRPDNKEEEK